MSYWSWWFGGLSLAGVVLLHWFILGRQMAVSGRFTAIVNRLRFGDVSAGSEVISEEDMIAAMRAATAEAFGDDALEDSLAGLEEAELHDGQGEESLSGAEERPVAAALPPLSLGIHVIFLLSLILGGTLSSFLSDGGYRLTFSSLRGEVFPQLFGNASWTSPAILGLGGILVGFGTRMSSGCTSGHGLCGVSRVRPAGLLATACFFGAGIALSLLLSSVL